MYDVATSTVAARTGHTGDRALGPVIAGSVLDRLARCAFVADDEGEVCADAGSLAYLRCMVRHSRVEVRPITAAAGQPILRADGDEFVHRYDHECLPEPRCWEFT